MCPWKLATAVVLALLFAGAPSFAFADIREEGCKNDPPYYAGETFFF